MLRKLRAVPVVQKLRFAVDAVAGNNNEHVVTDLICSADGGHGRRLILAHLQGDSHTNFSISPRRNGIVKFQLNQPFLADSLCHSRLSSTFLSENSVSLLSSTSASAMVDGSSPVTADTALSEILSPEN